MDDYIKGISKLLSIASIILAVVWTVVEGSPNNWAIYFLCFAILLKL